MFPIRAQDGNTNGIRGRRRMRGLRRAEKNDGEVKMMR